MSGSDVESEYGGSQAPSRSDRENIIVHADRLRRSNVQKKELREYAVDIARRLNEEIRERHSQGLHSLETEIPITFTVSNMSNSDSQRIIWYTVLKWLQMKTYRVRLDIKRDSCTIHLTWISEEEESLIILQKQFIAKYSK